MARKGLLTRLDPKEFGRTKKERLWVVSEFGEQILRGRLSASVERAIENAAPGTAVLTMRALMRRSYIEAGEEEATVVRRQFQHDAAQRPR